MTRLVRATIATRVLEVLEHAAQKRPRGIGAEELASIAGARLWTTRKYLTDWLVEGIVEREQGAALSPRGRIVSAYRLRQGATR